MQVHIFLAQEYRYHKYFDTCIIIQLNAIGFQKIFSVSNNSFFDNSDIIVDDNSDIIGIGYSGKWMITVISFT